MGPITDGFQHMKQYRQLQWGELFLSLCSSDNCIFTTDGHAYYAIFWAMG